MPEINRELWVKIAVYLFLGWLYWFTKAQFLTYGDAISFWCTATSGWEFQTNASSHWLYVNVCRLAILAFGRWFGSVDIMIGVSLISGWLSLVIFGEILAKTLKSTFPAVFTVLILGTAFTVWRQNIVIEVYALNNLIFVCFLYALGGVVPNSTGYSPKAKYWFLLMFFFGLSLNVHIQNLLLIPLLLYLFRISRLPMSTKLTGVLIATVVSSPLVLFPLLMNTNTLASVLFDYHFQDQALNFSISDVFSGLLRSIGYQIYNFGAFNILIVLGFWQLLKDSKQMSLIMLLLWLPFWVFAARYKVSDHYVFFLQSYIILSLYIAHYLCDLKLEKLGLAATMLVLAPMLNIGVYYFARVIAVDQGLFTEFDQRKAYKGGINYYTWPVMRKAPDPLNQCKTIKLTGVQPMWFEEISWNYQLLEKHGKLD